MTDRAKKVFGLLFARSGQVALVLLLAGYMVHWIWGNREMLFDPMLQADDVRTHVYHFHRYADNPEIAHDPISRKALSMVTPGVRILYRLIVPLVGVPVGAKTVQGISYLLIMAPVCFAFRRKTAAAFPMAVLVVFFVFHTSELMARTAGGLQRSFAVPSMVLWIVGAAGSSRGARGVAVAIAALTYPVAMALLLAAEIVYVLLGTGWTGGAESRRQLLAASRWCAAVLCGCLLLTAPYMIVRHDAGPAHNLLQAMENPAFGENGRIRALPFPDPLPKMGRMFLVPLKPGYRVEDLDGEQVEWMLLAIIGCVALLVLGRSIPLPRITLSLFAASIGMFILARLMAFHLYWPCRYYELGLPLVCICGISEVITQFKVRRSKIPACWAAFAVIVGILASSGDGIRSRVGLELDGRQHAKLFEYFKSTPLTTRIACHPMDGDDVPFWSGRPTTGGYETLQPWFVDSWRRQKEFTEEVLTALYATDRETLLAFCRKHRITHLLLRGDRYSDDFKRRARMFEPFGSFTDKLLRSVGRSQLVLAEEIRSEAAFRYGPYVVIDVDDLH